MNRRTPLIRRRRLRAKANLERRTRLRPVDDAEKREARHAKHFGEGDAYAGWLRSLPCAGCGLWLNDRMHAHHVRSRGAGGTERDLVSLCCYCHEAVHRLGRRTWEEKLGADLRAEADRRWLEWRAFVAGRTSWEPPF